MTFSSTINRFQPAVWFGALLLFIVLFERRVTALPAFGQQPLLPGAVAFDLLVFVPGLFYVVIIRRYKLATTSLLGAVGACLALALWVIPAAQQPSLRALRFLPALLEAATLAVLAAKARRFRQAYRAAYAKGPDFWSSASAAMPTLGPAGRLLLAEMELLRYALLGWWALPETKPGVLSFSSFRESGFTAFAVMLGVALVVETAVVHLLASYWNSALAAWLLLVDLYAVVVLIGHSHAVRLRPSWISADFVTLNVGSMWQLATPRTNVVSIEALHDAPAPRHEILNLTRLLFTSPNLLLTFAEPVVVKGPYGSRRIARRAAVYLDQPQQFTAAVHCSTR